MFLIVTKLTLGPPFSFQEHKVYIILENFRQKKKKKNINMVSFRQWLVTLGFKQDGNFDILGESCVCDHPLNPNLHPS